jgi:hypothetical protein
MTTWDPEEQQLELSQRHLAPISKFDSIKCLLHKFLPVSITTSIFQTLASTGDTNRYNNVQL